MIVQFNNNPYKIFYNIIYKELKIYKVIININKKKQNLIIDVCGITEFFSLDFEFQVIDNIFEQTFYET